MPKRTPPGKSTVAPVPDTADLEVLREAAAGCRACPLWKTGTQTVFGEREGPPRSGPRVMFVGEQPGDAEDRAGRPFVGPAGKLLDKALETVGIARGQVYVTNAVKHFKWTRPEGTKRRIHSKPSRGEVLACQPWLLSEIRAFRPEVIVCLGATAAQSLLGASFRVTQRRGELIPSEWAPHVLATVHPSSILRAPDEQARDEALRGFFQDLHRVARLLKELDVDREQPLHS